jgi:hypothetical protein
VRFLRAITHLHTLTAAGRSSVWMSFTVFAAMKIYQTKVETVYLMDNRYSTSL